MRSLVVVNHKATTTSPRTLDVMLSALRHDLKIDVAETKHRGHAASLARTAREDGADLVVAVGGDGTVNEVVNGLLDDDVDAARSPVPGLAILPGGSTNVFARNLGLPADPVEATGQLLGAVREGRRRPIGLGRLDERWFTFCAGVGFDADVVRAVEEQRARGRRSTVPLYARTALRRYFAQPHRRRGGTITMERGFVPAVPNIAVAVVTNSAPWTYLGRRAINPSPNATFDRGLDVFALTSLRMFRTLRHFTEISMTSRGTHGADVVSLHDQTDVTFRSDEQFPIQVDGDYVGERSAVRLRSIPSAIDIVC
jgi:diacylglycerol kinase family enzyme